MSCADRAPTEVYLKGDPNNWMNVNVCDASTGKLVEELRAVQVTVEILTPTVVDMIFRDGSHARAVAVAPSDSRTTLAQHPKKPAPTPTYLCGECLGTGLVQLFNRVVTCSKGCKPKVKP